MHPGIIIGIVVGVIALAVVGWFVAKSMKGKMTLTLTKGGYSTGESVQGNLTVLLKKDLEAQRFFVALIGYEVRERRDSDGDRRTESHEIYRDEVDLEPAQMFPSGFQKSYPFEIPAPGGDHLPRVGGGGMLDGVNLNIGGFNIGGGSNRTRLKWKVEGRLDVKGIDVTASRSVQINPR